MSGSTLPRPPSSFAGHAGRLIEDSTPVALPRDEPPPGAPNVVLIMLDDVGFGTFSAFGGPVPTPVCDRIAAQGLRYNQFHTTALCSPTRAALLTGRNHHAVHMGGIPEGANSFPGYDSVIPRSAATVAEVLRLNGYATGCFGKWHLTPTWEQGPAGPFDRWPTGMGFERFYGIINAEASQWEPPVYDQTTPVAPYVGRPDYHLTEDLADQAIRWFEQIDATAPDRPFFLYFPTAAVHTPHHVPSDWIERFRGAFDDGWDSLREQIYERQLEQGVIPPDTRLTPRPAQIPAWDEYPERYRPVAARLMETFAAFVAHTDHHIGRVLDAIDRSGRGDDTLVLYLTGDNGASAEGTIHGAWGAPSFQNGVPEDPEWLLERMEDFGTARCENHYNVGWAWALDSPFQWVKQVASHFGGTRNGLAVRWPKVIEDAGAVREQFHHVVDIASTIFTAAGIAPPDVVHGVEQQAVDGIPMNDSFIDASTPGRTSQYFEMLGNRAMYHDGWIASCFHGRLPWNRFEAAPFDGPQERWELYDVRHDFSQSVDLADEYPDVLADLQRRFDEAAQANQVYPLRDPSMRRTRETAVPSALAGATSMTYTTAHVRIPEPIVINLKNCSWRITADIETVADVPAVGVIACQGGNMNGWSLYLDADSRPTFLYNCFGRELTYAVASNPIAAGHHRVVAEFASDGGIGAGGRLVLRLDEVEVAEARLERTVPVVFSMSGETFDVGIDTGAPVGPYSHLFECTAKICGVTLERLSQPTPAERTELADREFRANVSSQ